MNYTRFIKWLFNQWKIKFIDVFQIWTRTFISRTAKFLIKSAVLDVAIVLNCPLSTGPLIAIYILPLSILIANWFFQLRFKAEWHVIQYFHQRTVFLTFNRRNALNIRMRDFKCRPKFFGSFEPSNTCGKGIKRNNFCLSWRWGTIWNTDKTRTNTLAWICFGIWLLNSFLEKV